MKIVYLIDDFPPERWTSSGILTLALAEKMLTAGHQIFVITTVQDKTLAGQSTYEGLKVFKIYTDYNIRWRSYLSLYNYQTIGAIDNILKNLKPDIGHFQHIHYYLSYAAIAVAKKYCQKVFMTAHDVQSFHYGKFTEFIDTSNSNIPVDFNYHITEWQLFNYAKKWYNPFRNMIIRHYLKKLDKIFSVSKELKSAMQANGITNVEVIYNGIEVDLYDKINEKQILDFKIKYKIQQKKIILFGGRLSHLKGAELAFQYLNKVSRVMPQTVLMVTGTENSYAHRLKENLQKLGLNDNKVVFTGFLNRQEIYLANKSCDLALVPSICFDSFPTTNLEAMAAQKPILATCFGGSREIIEDKKTGYLINPFNIDEVAAKIILLLKDKNLAEILGEAGYQRVKTEFSLARQYQETLKRYQL